MTAEIIDGKKIASVIRDDIKQQITQLTASGSKKPCLAVILVGDDPASSVYVNNKDKACVAAGIQSKRYNLPKHTTQPQLEQLISDLNNDSSVNGILLQLPLPGHLNAAPLLSHINPEKDIDGFHPYNFGRLGQRTPLLQPCTPLGIMKMLDAIEVSPKGKDCVIIGASNIVGRPMGLALLNAGATITICHRFTKNLATKVASADILVVAAGSPGLVPGEWIKEGATVIDVGMNRLDNGKLVGDVEFEQACSRAAFITPYPGAWGL